MSLADHIKSQLDIAAVVADYVPLKKCGGRLLGLCPFHAEKTASFGVKVEEQFYKCFGCDAKGDVIRFVQEIEGVSFTAACNLLVERYGVSLPDKDASVPAPSFTEADKRDARAWRHGMVLWIDEQLAWMKSRVTDADFECAIVYPDAPAPKTELIQFWTRKREAFTRERWGDHELMRRYLQAKSEDAEHAGSCVQRAKANAKWWRQWQQLIDSLIKPYPATMPDGPDPDDFIRKYGAAAFHELIDNPTPWFVWDAAMRDYLKNPQGIAGHALQSHLNDTSDRGRAIGDFFGYFFPGNATAHAA